MSFHRLGMCFARQMRLGSYQRTLARPTIDAPTTLTSFQQQRAFSKFSTKDKIKILSNEDLVVHIMQKQRVRTSTPDHVSVRIILDEPVEDVESGSVISLAKAISTSVKLEKDLVAVTLKQDIPVIKIADLGKELHKQSEKRQSKTTRALLEKEVRFRAGIEENDLQRKTQNVINHLEKGHTCVIRVLGRRYILLRDPDAVPNMIQTIIEKVKDYGEPSRPARVNLAKSNGQVTVAPLPGVIKKN